MSGGAVHWYVALSLQHPNHRGDQLRQAAIDFGVSHPSLTVVGGYRIRVDRLADRGGLFFLMNVKKKPPAGEAGGRAVVVADKAPGSKHATHRPARKARRERNRRPVESEPVDAYKNEDTTKSVAGIRQVPLSSAMLAELRKWKDAAKSSELMTLCFRIPRADSSITRTF